MSRPRRRAPVRRRRDRSWRRGAVLALVALLASGTIVAVLVHLSQPPAHVPFHFPTPAAATPAAAEIEPSERRQLEEVLDRVRDDAANDAHSHR